MSFTEKIAGLFAQQTQQDSMQPDAPWYMKHGGRVLGIVGAFFAILFGLYNALGIVLLNVKCLISGILQMLLGFTVMSLEAPFCFFCIGFVKTMSDTVDRGPMWRKAAAYCGLSLIPIILCPGLGSLFGCGLIFGTGVIYGMMSLGKKASAEEMRQAAINAGLSGGATPNPTTNDRASIVKNAQPFSFTGAVGTDSNV